MYNSWISCERCGFFSLSDLTNSFYCALNVHTHMLTSLKTCSSPTWVKPAQAGKAIKRHLKKARLLFRSWRSKNANEAYFQGLFKDFGLGITPRLNKILTKSHLVSDWSKLLFPVTVNFPYDHKLISVYHQQEYRHRDDAIGRGVWRFR